MPMRYKSVPKIALDRSSNSRHYNNDFKMYFDIVYKREENKNRREFNEPQKDDDGDDDDNDDGDASSIG